MGKYSSDSENEKRSSKISTKSKSRRRSSSSDSDDSRGRRRRDKRSSRKSRSRSRDRSRDRYSRSRRSRSRSTSYKTSKSKARRSSSRDRYRDRYKRSRSRDKYRSRRSRSRSKDYIKEYVSKPKKRSSSESSSSSSGYNKRETPKTSTKKGKEDIGTRENSVKSGKTAARASPECVIIDSETLDEINNDGFAPKQFSSSKSKKVPDNIVIDLKKNTIKVPEVEQIEIDSIFHHNLFLNEEARMEKWVRELYSFRQKALQQGPKNDR